MNVLIPCEMPKSLNIEKMKEFISAYIEPRKEYYKDKNRPPFIEEEFSEYFTAKATLGKEIGSGHCAMDVKTDTDEGIDATCLVLRGRQSNEKSLMQNFCESGNSLDTLFQEKKDNEAVELFRNDYYTKINKCKDELKLNEMYILVFISTQSDIYLINLKINSENIKHVSSGGFVNKQKNKCVNINLNNFINSKYGKATLYKSKKRLELRLFKNILECGHAVKMYTMI